MNIYLVPFLRNSFLIILLTGLKINLDHLLFMMR
jgi:hypothetical protein